MEPTRQCIKSTIRFTEMNFIMTCIMLLMKCIMLPMGFTMVPRLFLTVCLLLQSI